jgi:hypothetical protein
MGTHGKTKTGRQYGIPTLAEAAALQEEHERKVAAVAEQNILSDVAL